VAVLNFVGSACEVAVTVTLAGSPAATVGAVYLPVESIEPALAGEIDQFLVVSVELVTVALKVWNDAGHPAAVLFGHRLTVAGVTLEIATGGLLLPPPQATSTASSNSVPQNPKIAACLEMRRPISPTRTMPAMGKVNGNHRARRGAGWSAAVP